jgi:hypothetical protein
MGRPLCYPPEPMDRAVRTIQGSAGTRQTNCRCAAAYIIFLKFVHMLTKRKKQLLRIITAGDGDLIHITFNIFLHSALKN